MKSFKPMLIIASISLLTLVGCNKPEQAATETKASKAAAGGKKKGKK